jgi:hypothetical protein
MEREREGEKRDRAIGKRERSSGRGRERHLQ